jgi:hypothetical protein
VPANLLRQLSIASISLKSDILTLLNSGGLSGRQSVN